MIVQFVIYFVFCLQCGVVSHADGGLSCTVGWLLRSMLLNLDKMVWSCWVELHIIEY